MNEKTRVGLLYSTSGATSIVEARLLEASLLGIERANADIGAGLEPVVADIRSDPDTAARAAHELLTGGKVKFLVGCYTSACRKALIPVLEETGGALVYPTIYEGEEAHPGVFYFGAVPNQQVDPLLSWTISHLSARFVLVGSDYVYPRSVNRQVRGMIERAGGQILHEAYFPLGWEDFSRFLQALPALRGWGGAPVVFSTLVGRSIPAFYRQHREGGLGNAIVSPITSEVELRSMGLAAAAGHYFADGHLEPPGSARDGFATEYRRRFGDQAINGMMAAAYEAVQMLARCHRRAGGGAARTEATRKVRSLLKAPFHETPRGSVMMDSLTQHAWLWTRVARVGDRGQIEPLWTSPGPMPPRPYCERPAPGPASPGSAAGGGRVPDAFADLIGDSEAFRRCVRMARIAGTDVPVLIRGESGTGKEMVARAIHELSRRAAGPFVALNCAAIPRDLIASELFGYAPGAFTGARREGSKGKFELAGGGTLFLDEVSEMPLEMQASLLRALEEKRVVPVGGGREVEVDIRVIAATNRNVAPEQEPVMGLRPDLYFRLAGFRIDIPPLRSRREDVHLLAEATLARLNLIGGCRLAFSREARAALAGHTWPGNARELENAVERAFHVAVGSERIEVGHLPEVVAAAAATPADAPDAGAPGMTTSGEGERQAISRAIALSGHNLSRASRMLGVSRSTLYRRLKALHLVVPDEYPREKTRPDEPVRR
ncbi:MAG TPA: transporter substrate-binding protein [Anaeromyxobacteraceae bacterium]|nr:transporter substrate-binding protein [Anaeromyxobacteraceae bacterium]